MSALKLKRLAHGLKQIDVARAVGKTKQAVSLWENGEADIPERCYPALAKLFKETPEQFARSMHALAVAEASA